MTIGYGKTLNATSTSAKLTFSDPKRMVSIYNTGAVILHVLFNCETADLDDAYSGGTTIPIPAGQSFDYIRPSGFGYPEIKSLCYRTASSTATVYVGSY